MLGRERDSFVSLSVRPSHPRPAAAWAWQSKRPHKMRSSNFSGPDRTKRRPFLGGLSLERERGRPSNSKSSSQLRKVCTLFEHSSIPFAISFSFFFSLVMFVGLRLRFYFESCLPSRRSPAVELRPAFSQGSTQDGEIV